jgi:tRNA(fMet)-specific endonuclease VapC
MAQVDVLLAGVDILPFDEPAARRFGKLKADLEKAGISLAMADLQIAAIALYHQVPLVTHNQRHFNRVPGLNLEDWLV